MMVFDGPSKALLNAAGINIRTCWLAAIVAFGMRAPVALCEESKLEQAEGPTVIFGGDVNLGRKQNAISAAMGPADALGRLKLNQADLSIVNLESVVSAKGKANEEKGGTSPYYFRGRPELVAVLTEAGVDVVQTANNHSFDYGSEALLDQLQMLDEIGISHVGAGANREQACRPVYRDAGPLTVAFFAVDATLSRFAATRNKPGTCYLSIKKPDVWRELLTPRISQARERAHVVLVAVHWGSNFRSKPRKRKIRVGHAIVEAGADAVLGTSAHKLQGIEIYKGRPIIHDAGNLLFDFKGKRDSGLFTLVLAPEGVKQVWFEAVLSERGWSHFAKGGSRARILREYTEATTALGAAMHIQQDQRAVVDLGKLPRRVSPRSPGSESPIRRAPPGPLTQPPSECVVSEVPSDARIQPMRLGPLTLLGIRVAPLRLEARARLWFETFWTLDAPTALDIQLISEAVPVDGDGARYSSTYEPCDWQWPSSRWEPGPIYRDYHSVRPPKKREMKNGKFKTRVTMVDRQRRPISQPYEWVTIEVAVPGLALDQ